MFPYARHLKLIIPVYHVCTGPGTFESLECAIYNWLNNPDNPKVETLVTRLDSLIQAAAQKYSPLDTFPILQDYATNIFPIMSRLESFFVLPDGKNFAVTWRNFPKYSSDPSTLRSVDCLVELFNRIPRAKQNLIRHGPGQHLGFTFPRPISLKITEASKTLMDQVISITQPIFSIEIGDIRQKSGMPPTGNDDWDWVQRGLTLGTPASCGVTQLTKFIGTRCVYLD